MPIDDYLASHLIENIDARGYQNQRYWDTIFLIFYRFVLNPKSNHLWKYLVFQRLERQILKDICENNIPKKIENLPPGQIGLHRFRLDPKLWGLIYFRYWTSRCIRCGKQTISQHRMFYLPYCRDCHFQSDELRTITKTFCREAYLLQPHMIEHLPCAQVYNPMRHHHRDLMTVYLYQDCKHNILNQLGFDSYVNHCVKTINRKRKINLHDKRMEHLQICLQIYDIKVKETNQGILLNDRLSIYATQYYQEAKLPKEYQKPEELILGLAKQFISFPSLV